MLYLVPTFRWQHNDLPATDQSQVIRYGNGLRVWLDRPGFSMPFVRLAMVRYQPNALPAAKVSKVTLSEFAQVLLRRRAVCG